MRCDVKLEFPVRDVAEVRVYRSDCALLVRLSASPLVHYRTADGDDIHTPVPVDFDLPDDDDPWIRTGDFTRSGAIGRCWVYRIKISPRRLMKMDRALAYLEQQGVAIMECGSCYSGLPLTVRAEHPDFFCCVQEAEGLTFPVLFLVNVLVHKGIINQHQLTPEFLGLLRGSRDDDDNVAALKDFWGDKLPVFDACRRLTKALDRVSPKLLGRGMDACHNHTVGVRRLVITPTRAYCLPPEEELSNRLLRHYHHVADRFLRVTFMDEAMEPLNNNSLNFYAAPILRELMSDSFKEKTTVQMRVRTVMTKGFQMCGRKYSLLAFSPNQLRDRSAWFFAEDGNTTVESIRGWMGRFTCRNVAKHAARMGQCFSSSYATVTVQPHEVNENLADVERNGYTFSDGIGKIVPDLAMEVAQRLQLTADPPPSAYQIRFGGYKGVIAVWQGDSDDGIRLSLRPSMKKFDSHHNVIEVLAWTRFQPGFLNRQIIVLLSSMGVSDAVFWRMQKSMVGNLEKIFTDSEVALETITRSCSPENANKAARMLSAGFSPRTEPHLRAMLSAIRSAQLHDLREKSRIFVPKGRWLIGCLDELGILKYGQCFIRASAPWLDPCFVKHGPKIIVGTVVVAKNPCYHPGDVRILEAVDVPELRHLVDCLVFPQNGERPHPDEASGSDLDGDIYFVTWDEQLIPPRKQSWKPMDYSPPKVKLLRREVTQNDTVDFFLENMVSDNLGMISNAHVVHADLSEHGAMDEKCIFLAQLAATAVDFPKTGKFVAMPCHLRPKIYPDFLLKEDSKSYKSEKILGRLYRSIQEASGADWVSHEAWTLHDLPYDTCLEVTGASDFLVSAWQCKCLYDRQLNALLNQYGVRTEAELVTGHIWSIPRNNCRKLVDVKDRLKNAYNALQKEYWSVFQRLASYEAENFNDDEKDWLYEMKASAWYQVTYHPKWTEKSRALLDPDDEERMPVRLSFAWIAVDYLARIKIRCHGGMEVGGRRPAGRLAA
ncbi:probable RNA-dependent RNA polymerase SHL2 [Hordeum vulgare subsp. vulgare]|uniref:probable RNA-dependent RNA polymerase SHL2 n=1 Tax=Hordeum vulgare subsp. vulgare TaxID=112509 RepID=UPI001D1A384C|nr:probable RNA-dependent RNA polymerase SHL2 [Hordeum vulgare subsp. vulgare]